jgi:hypothetical protein
MSKFQHKSYRVLPPYQALALLSLPPLRLKLRDGVILRKMYNNVFCYEYCVRCREAFYAGLTHIWGIEPDGYVCYKCADDLVNHCKFQIKEKVKVILV